MNEFETYQIALNEIKTIEAFIEKASYSEVDKKLSEVRDIIDLFDPDDEYHNKLKFEFHRLKYLYSKMIGKPSVIDEMQMMKFKKKIEASFKEVQDPVEEKKEEVKIQIEKEIEPEKPVLNGSEEILKSLEDDLDEKLYKEIKDFLRDLKNKINAIEDYHMFSLKGNAYYRLISDQIIDAQHKFEDTKKQEFQDKSEDLSSLNQIIMESLNSARLEFVKSLILNPNKEKIFFGEYLTKEMAKRRYRELSLIFHPDKIQNITSEDRAYYNEIFHQITMVFNTLNPKNNNLEFIENKANTSWQLGMDYKNAMLKQFDKLKIITKKELVSLLDQELQKRSKIHFLEAYHYYYSACIQAIKQKNIEKQVHFLGNMALCLYSLENSLLEAQICVFSGARIFFNNLGACDMSELERIQQIKEKILGKKKVQKEAEEKEKAEQEKAKKEQAEKDLSDQDSDNEEPEEANTDKKEKKEEKNIKDNKNIKKEDNIPYSQVQIYDPGLNKHLATSLDAQNRFKSQMKNDLQIIASELIFQPDESIVGIETSREMINQKQLISTGHHGAGIATLAVSSITGVVGISSTATTVIQLGVVTALGSVVSIVGAVTMGLAFLVGGGFLGIHFWKKGSRLMEEPKIRQKLNEMFTEAVEAYHKNDYDTFLDKLSQEYAKDKRKLFVVSPSGISIDFEENFIPTLISHSFTPDSIAYIINLIGQALLSRKCKFDPDQVTQTDLNSIAVQAFKSINGKKLEEQARKLDESIQKVREKSLKSKLKAFFTRTDVTSDIYDYATKCPFIIRLREIGIVAEMNLAIIRIIDGDIYNAKTLITRLIREFESGSNNFCQGHTMRLELLRMFLTTLDGELFEEEEAEKKKQESNANHEDESTLEYLKEKLAYAKDPEEKKEIYLKILAIYHNNTKKYFNDIRSFEIWNKIEAGYDQILLEDEKDEIAGIGKAECMLCTYRYKLMLSFLQKNKHLSKNPEYYSLIGQAHIKRLNYKSAIENLVEANLREKTNKYKKQLDHAKNLYLNGHDKKIENYAKMFAPETHYFNHGKVDETKDFTVISFDAGGTRGIMSAFWACELERRTKRKISDLFHLSAGTSTGSILAAGLGIQENGQPKYTAYDLLDFFRTKSPKFFTRELTSIVFGPKYTDTGRKSTLYQYFPGKLDQLLCPVVIPVVTEALNQTREFSTYQAFTDPNENFDLYEVLLCSTAAPTYFPAYKMKNPNTAYYDGSVYVKNPSIMAYTHAISQMKQPTEKIRVISLGTGCYLPERLNPNIHKGNLLNALNIKSINLPSQQGNIEKIMVDTLGKRYTRIECWLEEPIQIDAHSKEEIENLLEIANLTIEEIDNSEENTFNKIVEFFDLNDQKQ